MSREIVEALAKNTNLMEINLRENEQGKFKFIFARSFFIPLCPVYWHFFKFCGLSGPRTMEALTAVFVTNSVVRI